MTMLGIIIGVAAVLVMVAVGGGRALRSATASEPGLGLRSSSRPAPDGRAASAHSAGSFNRLTVDDALALQREEHAAGARLPVIFAPAQIVSGTGNWRAVCYGVDADYREIRDTGRLERPLLRRRRPAQHEESLPAPGPPSPTVVPGRHPRRPDGPAARRPLPRHRACWRKGQERPGRRPGRRRAGPYTTVRTRLAGRMFIAQILASTSSPATCPPPRTRSPRSCARRTGWPPGADDFRCATRPTWPRRPRPPPR
ncbi:MAG: ABC transporter permease [bacterium]|nr:ABC transporter permease [bacterium]